jgi:hypothetical protein
MIKFIILIIAMNDAYSNSHPDACPNKNASQIDVFKKRLHDLMEHKVDKSSVSERVSPHVTKIDVGESMSTKNQEHPKPTDH